MSTVERAERWLAAVGDWSNSILVKETRQALKSRQFVITFMLLLIASWVVSVFGSLVAGDALRYGSGGMGLFPVYYTVLLVASLIIVPYGAFRSLLSEREQNTFELLTITSLSPAQIVWGKLLSALVQVFIYYSAIAPFIAFTSLLDEFDFPVVAYLLVVGVVASLAFSMMALMFSTAANQRQWQALNSVAVLGGLLFGFFSILSLCTAFTVRGQGLPFDSRNFWWANGFALVTFLSYFILARQITTAQLTFQADNHSTGIRVTCAVQFLLLWIGCVAYVLIEGTAAINAGTVSWLAMLSTLQLCAVGLFVSTESDFLSRRIRRGLPKRRSVRVLVAPFLPGGGRGYLYFALQVGLMWLIAAGLLLSVVRPAATRGSLVQNFKDIFAGEGTAWTMDLQLVTCFACYAIIYIGITAALGRWGRRLTAELRPAHVRVLAVLILLAGMIGPYIPTAIRWYRIPGYQLHLISNPAATIWEVQQRKGEGGVINPFAEASRQYRTHSQQGNFRYAVRRTWIELHTKGDGGIVMVLVIGAACVLALNIKAVFNGVAQIRDGEAVPRTRRSKRRTESHAEGNVSGPHLRT